MFNITINDVDEFNVTAPSDTDTTVNAVDENSAIGTDVGITASASDSDATTNGVTYSLFDDDGGNFTIDANTGIVTTNTMLDREALSAMRTITVRATSQDGSTNDTVFNIALNDLDEFDVTASVDADGTANAVDENSAIGTMVGITASASDSDATTNAVTYSLTDNAGGRFAIDSGSGVVTVADGTLLDREAAAMHNITVRATSADGSTNDTVFTIAVLDVSEFVATPIIDNDATAETVAENAAVGTAVGISAFSTDADSSDTISYSLDDNDSGRFSIDTNLGIVTVSGAIDREADGASRSITVRATSTDGSFQTRSFSIAISDVDEFDVGAIADGNVAANAVYENSAIGTGVGLTAVAFDADATNSNVTFALLDNDGGRFSIDTVSGIVRVAGAIDLETDGPTRFITVRATSSDGSFADQLFAIGINGVNEAPSNLVPATHVATEEISGTIAGISVSDVDAATGDVTTRLQVVNGTLDVTLAGAAIISAGANSSSDVTIRGTLADLNTTLTSLMYTGNVDVYGIAADTLTVTTDDLGNIGFGGGQLDIDTVQIDITEVNDAPQIDLDVDNSSGQSGADFANTFVEDGGPVRIADTDAMLADVDNATLESLQVVLINQFDGADELLMASTAGTSITANYSAGMLTLSGVDSIANYQQVLRTVTYENISQNPNPTTRTIEFVVNDGLTTSNLATATVVVVPQNDAPVAVTESYSVDNNGTLTVAAPGLLANDSDVDADMLTVTLTSPPPAGTLSLNADGSFTYVPNLNFSGTTSFTYVANDGIVNSMPTTVSIEVKAVAASPINPSPDPSPTPPPTDNSDDNGQNKTTPPAPPPQAESDDDEDSPSKTASRAAGPGAANLDAAPEFAPAETTFLIQPDEEQTDEQLILELFRAGAATVGSGTEHSRYDGSDTQRFGSVDLAVPFTEYELAELQRQVLWHKLDTLQEQLESEGDFHDHIAGTATVVTAAISTGYVIWALRGSFLLASFLSTVPTWRSLDPLPIIENGPEGRSDDDESLADIAERGANSDHDDSEKSSIANLSGISGAAQ